MSNTHPKLLAQAGPVGSARLAFDCASRAGDTRAREKGGGDVEREGAA